jgi:DNA-binding beta-propeller fold protein YncE
MRIYIRKDIAAQVSGLALQSSQIADLQPKVDVYASKRIEQAPVRTLAPGMLNLPRNFALAADGSVYIADSGNAQIVHVSADGKLIKAWGSRTPDGQTPPAPGTFNEPWGIAVDSQGNVYVADTWNHRIQKFDANGKFLLQWGTGGVSNEGNDRFWGPRGILVAPDGKVYITDTGNRRVVVFDSQGKYLFTFDTNGDAQLNEPVGIALGQDQHIYIGDTWNNRVAIFDMQGKYLSSFAVAAWTSTSVDDKPFIAVDGEGRVYVTDPEGARVIIFSATGEPLAAFGQTVTSGGLNLPTGIQINAQGEVYIADAGNNRLVVYPSLKP